jgi:RHS repeat-associated protein
MNWKQFSVYFIIAFFTNNVCAQNPLILNSVDNGTGVIDNKDYTSVILLPGYSCEGEENRKMNAFIDLSIVGQINYGSLISQEGFDDYTIDPSLPIVGFTPGVAGVSPSGAATYDIPIQLPSGTNGMMPSLSVSYNSQSGNGMLGMGWNLSGLSVISRVPKTICHNGKTEAIKFDYTDNFALDGNRLMGTNGTYGHNNATYGTEMETYVLVTSKGSSGNGPEWFEVKTKNGTTIEYGRTQDSRFMRTGGSEILFWRINKMYDQFGNYIVYEYINQDSESRINRIRYTGNFNPQNNQIIVEPYNVIQFSYTDREDKNEQYMSGTKLKTNTLLKSIRIQSEGSRFRKYQFEYAQDFSSHLISVAELGATEDDELNKVKFKYGLDNNIPIEITGHPFTPFTCSAAFTPQTFVFSAGDFNGDGFGNVIIHNRCLFLNTVYSEYVTVAKLNTTSSPVQFSNIISYNIPEGYGMFNMHYAVGAPNYKSLDFNGDGHQDILIYARSPLPNSGGSSILTDVKVVLFGSGQPEVITLYSTPTIITELNAFHVGDFNGDGKDEIILVKRESLDLSSPAQVLVFEANPAMPEQALTHYLTNPSSFGWFPVASKIVQTGDFNGDGKLDLLAIYHAPNNTPFPSFAHIYTLNYQNGQYTATIIYQSQEDPIGSSQYFPTKYHEIFLGDFNGDGNTDILSCGDGVNWHVSYSTGNNGLGNLSFIGQHLFNAVLDTDLNWTQIPLLKPKIGDFNGDGLHDILIVDNGYLRLYYSSGSSFNLTSYPSNAPNMFNAIACDINGDGNSDLVTDAVTSYYISTIYFNKNSLNKLLTGVSNGIVKESFQYEYLNRSANYLVGNNSTFPLKDIKVPLSVVVNQQSRIPSKVFNNKSYFYEEGRLHSQGKGFLGFKTNKIVDEIQNLQLSSSVFLDIDINPQMSAPNYFPKRMEQASNGISWSGGNMNVLDLLQESTSHIQTVDLEDGIWFQKLVEAESVDYINNIHSLKIMDYDTYGNMNFLQENLLDGSLILESTITTYGNFLPALPNLPPSLPESVTIQTQKGSNPALFSTTDFDYFSTGLLKEKTSRYNTEAWSKEEYTYNNFGLTETVIISGDRPEVSLTGTVTYLPIPPIQTDHYVYTPNGRNLKQHTDKYGFTTSYEYYNRWGIIKSVIDHRDNQSYFKYDGFGRLEKTIDYLGQESSVVRTWENSVPIYTSYDSYSDVLYSEINYFPNNRFVKQYFSGLGEERFKTYSTQFQDIKEINIFDNLSRLTWRNLPHYEVDNNIKVEEFGFDILGRLTFHQLLPITGTVNHTPNTVGLISSVVSNSSGNRSAQSDKSGKIIQQNDAGGNLNYTYLSGGLLKDVLVNNVVQIHNEYDEHGRQISLLDVNAGETTYKYDSFDRIVYQKDARENETRTYYDELGRVESNSVREQGSPIELFYTNEYYESGTEIHMLKKETAPSGCSAEYTYTEEGYIASITETVDGSSYTNTFQYDEFGKLIRKTYPSNFAIRYQYDAKGYLKKIVSDDNLITVWQIDNANAQGQITAYQLGNGVTVNQEFDEHYFPTLVAAQKQNEALFSFDYKFNEITGNLDYRKLGVNEESFLYDEDGLHRLTQVNINQDEVIEEFGYDPNGNIAHKTGVGVYNYHPQKLNAIDHIDWQGGMDEENANQIMLMQTVSYNHFNSVSELINVDNNLKVEFTYGPDDQRRKADYFVNDILEGWVIDKTRYYIGAYEKQVDASNNEIEVHYISAGGMLVAMYIIENGIGQYYYPHQDHLGSIIHITDENAEIVYTQSFDAWGRTRNSDDLTYEDITERPNWLWRGYTGHEHLDEFGLINMNGRLYDPVIGRMLSPDNYVQAPSFSQSYNRYSYVWNNPLKYNDPDGEWVNVLLGAALGGIAGYQIGAAQGATGWQMVGYIAAGAGIGALTSGVATGLSNAGASAMTVGATSGAIAGAGYNGLSSNWNTTAMLKGAVIGGVSGFVGAGVGAAIGGARGAFFGGAVSSGVNSKLNGSSWNDAIKSSIGGGTSAFATYHLSTFINWKFKGGNKIEDLDISYRQFSKMQGDFQRSRFWKKEYGGLLMEDKTVKSFSAKQRKSFEISGVPIDLPDDAIGIYHTHWAKPNKLYDITPDGMRITPDTGYTGNGSEVRAARYHSEADLFGPGNSIVINRFDGSYYPGSKAYMTSWSTGLETFKINPPINRFIFNTFFWQ